MDISAGDLDVSAGVISDSGGLIFDSGSWSPALTFGSGSTGLTYGTQTGTWRRSGNIFVAVIKIVLTAKGSSTGNVEISLPTVTGYTIPNNELVGVTDFYSNMSSLTSAPMGRIISGPIITLAEFGATTSSILQETNFSDTTVLRMIFTGRLT